MTALGHYENDAIEVTFTADMVSADYGVPGSPVWKEPTHVAIDTLKILGVECDPKALPSDLVAEIHRLADEIETWGEQE